MDDLKKANALESMFSRDDLDEIALALRDLHWTLEKEINDCDNNGFSDVSMGMEREREQVEQLLNLFKGAIDIERESHNLFM